LRRDAPPQDDGSLIHTAPPETFFPISPTSCSDLSVCRQQFAQSNKQTHIEAVRYSHSDDETPVSIFRH
jgi:hypothetical protein